MNLFYNKSIYFVEIRINEKLKSLFLIELKNKNLYVYEYYSSLDDLEISLSIYFIFYIIKNIQKKFLYISMI